MDADQVTTDGAHSRNVALDGLRAVAVSLVIVYHYAGRFAQTEYDRFALITHPGSHGVRVFFILSGFLITGCLAQRTHQG